LNIISVLKRFSLSFGFPDSFYFRKTSIMKRMEPGGAILLLKLTKLTNRDKSNGIELLLQLFCVKEL